MDNKTFLNSRKYIILLLLVCVIFFVLVIKAFEYLPQSDRDAVSSRENLARINTPADDGSVESSEDSVQADKKKELNIFLKTDDIDSDFEEIDPPPSGVNAGVNGVNGVDEGSSQKPANATSSGDKETKNIELSDEEMAYKILFGADKLRKSGEYSKAMEEYQKVVSMTNNSSITASGYEGISKIYAINKRYGTALSFAIKAFNMSPSSEREFLLAKLYYKTGDTYKATQRVNNILHRDFADDK